ncbi:MAG: VWA domain-containing protein [Acidobacteria bacterium]|nr:VWA domain-containing protein [Acidobacteriota bacterium]MXZ37541.1 VWA domain-containing protein [Holophagales bacterium]
MDRLRRGRLMSLARHGALLGTLLLPAAATAQQQDEPAVFSEVIDVRVVNAEVVVTDRDGNRVHGLTAADFELLVDGEPMPISYFTEVAEGFAQGAATGAVAGVPDLNPYAPVGTNFLIFIDDFFSIERDRNRVLDSLEEDLRELGPVDRVAAVAFDGDSLEMLTAWTNDPSVMEQALDRARRRTAYGLQRLSELRMSEANRESQAIFEAVADQAFAPDLREAAELQQIAAEAQQGETGNDVAMRAQTLAEEDAAALKDLLGTSLSSQELRYAQRLEDQLELSVLAAMATMRSLANQPGRKVMLLLAGGWPRSAALFTVAGKGDTSSFAASADGALMSEDELYGPLVSAANLIGYALYPVDLPGLSASFSGDAALGFGPSAQPDAGPGALEREDMLHSTLDLLADSTGGVSMINADRDQALSAAVEDTRSYYWIGFEPRRREDEAFHDIKVRLAGRPDLRVRTREGYVDMSRDREVSMTVDAAMRFGIPPDARPLEVRFSDPVRAGRRRMSMAVEVVIPLDHVELMPVAGGWRNELEVRVTAMDLDGNRSEMSRERILIAGPAKPRPGQVFYYETDLVFRRRDHTWVIAVHDPLTGTVLTSRGEVGRVGKEVP